MHIFKNVGLWQRTLGDNQNEQDQIDRERLRTAFLKFREYASVLAAEIHRDLPEFTVHDISHIDALWKVADLVAGPEYPVTPLEAFTLGGAFLLHDLGMSLSAYPQGANSLRETPEWRDALAFAIRRTMGRSPINADYEAPPDNLASEATAHALRVLHGKHAAQLATMAFHSPSTSDDFFLIENIELRTRYGELIGKIAYSHWWGMDRLRQEFGDREIGPMPGMPSNWTISPLKIACLLRAADACHITAERAPLFLQAIRRPNEMSAAHWNAQHRIETPIVKDGFLYFTSARSSPIAESNAWWTAYDLVSVANDELSNIDEILHEYGLPRFDARRVKGATTPIALAKQIKTDGWSPIDTHVRVTDFSRLVNQIGGAALYGTDPKVPLRELIQNARDAVVARRSFEQRAEHWGEITVRIGKDDGGLWIEVEDNGIGMSETVLASILPDFGASYWRSPLVSEEFPGLISRSFEVAGRYGIGFFSVFMISSRVHVFSRPVKEGASGTRVLEFSAGTQGRPLLRYADEHEQMFDPGTRVRVWLNSHHSRDGKGIIKEITLSWLGNETALPDGDWTLCDLCRWLCPALDVSLFVEGSQDRIQILEANDWKTISSKDLFHRLYFEREPDGDVFSNPIFSTTAKNLRPILDDNGVVIGRAALNPHFITPSMFFKGSNMQFDDWCLPVASLCGLRAHGYFMGTSGILISEPITVRRTEAIPVLKISRPLSMWATEQAGLLSNFDLHLEGMTYFASIIRGLGGDSGSLPIVRIKDQFLSADDIRLLPSMPNKIRLVRDHVRPHDNWIDRCKHGSNDGEWGISIGETNSFSLIASPEAADIFERATNIRWHAIWRSLRGAAYECIAVRWGVALDSVIEHAEIIPERRITNSEGREQIIPQQDILRRPP